MDALSGRWCSQAAKNSLALRFQSKASTITNTMIAIMLDVTVCEVWNQISEVMAPMMSITIKIVTSIRASRDPLRRPIPTMIVIIPRMWKAALP
jgi:hypothetical protein